jgi:hypothetical protein
MLPNPDNALGNYAFIDAQNLHQSSKHWGWKLDYLKLREFLRGEFNVTVAYLFLGYIHENQEIYRNLQKQGYVLVFKETGEHEEHIKGNCDVEMAMQALIDIPEYNKAVLVTGDSDFTPLVRYLTSNNRLISLLIPNNKIYSNILLRAGKGKIQFLNLLKEKLFAPMFPGQTAEDEVKPRESRRGDKPMLIEEKEEKKPIRRTRAAAKPKVISKISKEQSAEVGIFIE